MNTETIRITKLTVDPWGYPVAHWTGDRGSQGETRIGAKGEDPASCEDRAEAAIQAEMAEANQGAGEIHTLASLVAAAQEINTFARQFTIAAQPTSYMTGTAAALATVRADVCDDEGGPLAADATPVGTPRLAVDIEFFRESSRTYTAAGRAELAAAEAAERAIIEFCRSLGFRVNHESHVGSGEYGHLNQLILS